MRAGDARVQHHDHRLAEEGHAAPSRQSTPWPAAARALLLLVQLAQDPVGLLAQRRFDVAYADPARRIDRQAVGADDEADAAPAHARKRRPPGARQTDLAVGLRVAETPATHRTDRAAAQRAGMRVQGSAHRRARHGAGARGRSGGHGASGRRTARAARIRRAGGAAGPRYMAVLRPPVPAGVGLGVEAAHLGLDPGLDLAHQLVGPRPAPGSAGRSRCRSRPGRSRKLLRGQQRAESRRSARPGTPVGDRQARARRLL
jgi:hypothetical protein